MAKVQMLGLIEELIREHGPLRAGDIVKLADSRLPTRSTQPQNVVAKNLSLEVKNNAESKFIRVSPGLYGLRPGPIRED